MTGPMADDIAHTDVNCPNCGKRLGKELRKIGLKSHVLCRGRRVRKETRWGLPTEGRCRLLLRGAARY